MRVWLASLLRGVGALVLKKASTGGKVEETSQSSIRRRTPCHFNFCSALHPRVLSLYESYCTAHTQVGRRSTRLWHTHRRRDEAEILFGSSFGA